MGTQFGDLRASRPVGLTGEWPDPVQRSDANRDDEGWRDKMEASPISNRHCLITLLATIWGRSAVDVTVPSCFQIGAELFGSDLRIKQRPWGNTVWDTLDRQLKATDIVPQPLQ